MGAGSNHCFDGGSWCPKFIENVNEVGVVIYHGKSDIEKLEERQELKREQQAKADKVKAKARRFHR